MAERRKEGEAKKRQNELTSERASERGRTINRPTQRRVCVRAMALLLSWWCKSANTRKDLHEMS